MTNSKSANSRTETGIYVHRVLMVNWAMHKADIFGPIFEDGAVLVGNSGTGKSTFIDAMMTVLTGSTDRSIYNMAASANASSKRSFIDYVRGAKEGSSDKGRTDKDFTTHLAIEFIDKWNRRKLVYGICCDHDHTRPGNHVDVKRYFYEGEIDRDWYVEDGRAVSCADFKKALRELGDDEGEGAVKKARFFDSMQDYRADMCRRFNLDGDEFINSMKKMIALTKGGSLDDFVFKNLCGFTGPIGIDSMVTAMGSWKAMEKIQADTEMALKAIDEEIDRFGKWREEERGYRVAARAVDLAAIKRRQVKRDSLSKQAEAARRRLDEANAELDAANAALGVANDLHRSLIHAMGEDDVTKRMADIQEDIKTENDKAEGLQGYVDDRFSKVLGAAEMLDELADAVPLRDDASYIAYKKLLDHVYTEGQGVLSSDPRSVRDLVRAGDVLAEKMKGENDKLLEARLEAERCERVAASDLEACEKPGAGPDRHVSALLDWIESRCGVRPVMLADAIDIAPGEQAWGLAVEGVLGNSRFDLIVPERFHHAAWDAYRTFNGRRRGKLVESRAIKRHMSGVRPEEGSLATKVVSADDSIGDIALAYAGYILGRTACVTDMDAHVAESPKVAAVTADGAYYRGFARAQLDERVIGQRMVGAEARAAAARARRERALADMEAARHAKLEADAAIRSLNDLKAFVIGSETAFGEDLDYILKRQVDLDAASEKVDLLSAQLEAIDSSDARKLADDCVRAGEAVKVAMEKAQAASGDQGAARQALDTLEASIKEVDGEIEELVGASVPLDDEREEFDAQIAGGEGRAREDMAAALRHAENARDRARGALVEWRASSRGCIPHADIDAEADDNEVWQAECDRLRAFLEVDIKAQVKDLAERTEQSFFNEVIGILSNRLDAARGAVMSTNRELGAKEFSGKRYEFRVSKTKDPAYTRFYNMAMDPDFKNAQGGLWSAGFHERYAEEISDFMEVIRKSILSESESVKIDALRRRDGLLDPKNYLRFEMVQIDRDGSTTNLSSGISSSSGGEWALPLYLVLAAGLASNYKTKRYGSDGDTLRVAVLDEAFAGIDDQSAGVALDFLKSCGLQPILATPEAEKTHVFARKTSTSIEHRRTDEGFEFHTFVSAVDD